MTELRVTLAEGGKEGTNPVAGKTVIRATWRQRTAKRETTRNRTKRGYVSRIPEETPQLDPRAPTPPPPTHREDEAVKGKGRN
ncbi:hypothetical protein MRX96_024325 [Rhipicephalus microplus]